MKTKNIYSAMIVMVLGAILLAVKVLANQRSFETVQAKPIDFEKYIEKRDIETEVFGVSYNTDSDLEEDTFQADFDIPLEPDTQEEINRICDEYGICYELVLSMAEQESSFQPTAKNGNCLGLLQVNGKIHKDRMDRLGVTDLYDPVQNTLVAVDYLSELFEQDEDISLALMKYNMSHKKAEEIYNRGDMTDYAKHILDRSAELERKHGK